MSYFKPYIDSTGIHIPTYNDILEKMEEDAKTIFGSDIYLENDSADYQWISANALRESDALESLAYAYNSRSPATAIGSGLDAVVKINGLVRKSASYSTCSVKLSGTAGTVITGGIVQDNSGYKWDLPDTVTIGESGTVIVTVTCETLGAIIAMPGDINTIVTPSYGWASVTNDSSASVGNAVETDAELRARQALSTEIPSQTLLDGTIAGILSVPNVSRQKCYENDTNLSDVSTDNPYGLPAHSITCVVEGGTDAEIAEQIYLRKGIGCYTNGTTEVSIAGKYGINSNIRFYRPSYVSVDVTVNIKKYSGYTTATADVVKDLIYSYLNSLGIGDDLAVGILWSTAQSANADLTNPTYAVTSLSVAKHGGTAGTAEIVTAFNEVIQGNADYITVNVS